MLTSGVREVYKETFGEFRISKASVVFKGNTTQVIVWKRPMAWWFRQSLGKWKAFFFLFPIEPRSQLCSAIYLHYWTSL